MLYFKTYEKGPENDWVVFVHGAGGSSSIWFQQLKAFKAVFNVILVDLRGHGKSKDALQLYYEQEYTFDDISKMYRGTLGNQAMFAIFLSETDAQYYSLCIIEF